jgi:hypothetical protein
MAKRRLGKEERAFCRLHGIPEQRLFDATGHKRAEYREIMAIDEKWAAYGVTPCSICGNELRNRHGTCLMCDTKRLAYLFRSKLAGYLYVAIGADGDLMKIGFSTDPIERIKIANYEGWGGHYDWRVVAYAWSSQAGRIESRLHALFQSTSVNLGWYRNGVHTTTGFRSSRP